MPATTTTVSSMLSLQIVSGYESEGNKWFTRIVLSREEYLKY